MPAMTTNGKGEKVR